MQTSIRPRQYPVLKKDVWDVIRLARFNPARGSIGSNASRGKVMTLRSKNDSSVLRENEITLPTRKDDQQLIIL